MIEQKKIAGKFQRKFNDDQVNEMFDFWRNHDCRDIPTARHYEVGRSTIARYRKRGDWDARAEQIKVDVQEGQDRKAVKREISNLRMAKAVLKKEIAAYLHKKHKATGNLNGIVQLMRYIDELQGNMPTGDNNGDNIVNIYESLSPDDQERVRDNALVGLTDGVASDRGPFTPVPSGCVRTSE